MAKNTWTNKLNIDRWWKYVSFAFACFVAVIFITMIIFIIISAIPGFEKYGLDGILGTLEFNLNEDKASLWSPISVTLLVTFGAVLIATPIGIKTATFIKFRMSKKMQKTAFIIVQTLSGIPSVIFGLFALESLGLVVGSIFGLSTAYNIVNAIIMLTFMILPTIITLTLNTYNSISTDFILNPIALGTTRTKSIYRIFKKQARHGIIVAVIIAIGRAFGETMALSMILTSESYGILAEGFGETLTSGLGTLGSLIATNMFSETGGPAVRGVLYAFGIFLFILVMLLNGVILYISNRNSTHQAQWIVKTQKIVNNVLLWVPHTISNFFMDYYGGKKNNANYNNAIAISKHINKRVINHKLSETRTYWWVFWEWFCFLITVAFLVWICLDIITFNFGTSYDPQYGSAFLFNANTTGLAVVNTILIIFVALLISIPLALLIAIYLNEYARNQKLKNGILFFVDCLGSSPSIIFGMFGLAIFIEAFGWTLGGTLGKSLIAGALTISIVIVPMLIRTMQQALASVPMSVREGAYSLGCTKWETLRRVVLRQASTSLISAAILAIGRIMAETAPLYLTAGLTSVSGVGLLLPGQTLTTRIYAQMTSNDLNAFQMIAYECAFISLIIILLLILFGNFIVPNFKEIKKATIDNSLVLFNGLIYSFKDDKTLKQYELQVIKRTLYLTNEQAQALNIKHLKFYWQANKLYRIKYVSWQTLQQITEMNYVPKNVIEVSDMW